MSDFRILSDRRQALEDRFFKLEEAKQLEKLRDQLATQKTREELSNASGLDDNDLLDALIALDVHAQDLAALALIPLVHVAWADGSISDKEHAAILDAADQQGIGRGSHTHELLDSWLAKKPPASLFGAWSDYVAALLPHLDDSKRTSIEESILGLAHDVASAAGGMLGIASISAAEESALDAIRRAFEG